LSGEGWNSRLWCGKVSLVRVKVWIGILNAQAKNICHSHSNANPSPSLSPTAHCSPLMEGKHQKSLYLIHTWLAKFDSSSAGRRKRLRWHEEEVSQAAGIVFTGANW